MSSEPIITTYHQYYPPGVKQVLASGSSAWVGDVNETTVFKYPLAPGGDMERLKIEQKILEVICPHPRIITLKRVSDTGIYLERATNGTVANYLLDSGIPSSSISTLQRVVWCRETAEAVAYIHTRYILHCDIQPTNILLDDKLHIKLADFQGKLLGEDGKVLLDGWSGEPTRFAFPRTGLSSDVYTELFALGCTIYFIMMGYAVYPDIVDGSEDWRERVAERFEKKDFPQDDNACRAIIMKCWMQQYGSADEIVNDLEAAERYLGQDSE